MALLRFHEQFGMFDITPVENIFIDELMLRAPGDFVKIYLYGLKLCYHGGADMGIARMARDLGTEEESVRTAFLYWERQGVLRKVADHPEEYVYLNVKQELFSRSGGAPVDDSLYQYRDFNNALQEIYGNDRLLHPQDFQRIFDWIEVFGLEPDAVLLLVKDAMAAKPRSTVNYLDKQARYWANKGIKTREDAENYIASKKASFEGARHVLKQFRLRRLPTVDEEKLFLKWTEQWGFAVDAILHCCAQLNKIHQPNFAYLDKVLENQHNKGLHTVQEMAGYTRDDSLKEALTILGDEKFTEATKESYQRVLDMGFSEAAIAGIARLAIMRGHRRMADVETAAQTLKKRGIMEIAAIETLIREREAATKAFADILAQRGEHRPVQAREIDFMERWVQTIPNPDLIPLALEMARPMEKPLSYANKLLESWKAAGITTTRAAAMYKTTPDKPSKTVSAQNYSQREYTQEHWDSLLDDLFEEEK